MLDIKYQIKKTKSIAMILQYKKECKDDVRVNKWTMILSKCHL